MQTWADDSEEPIEVVWYRLDDDAPFFEGINRFMSRNYIGSRAENARNFTPGEQNFVECENSRSFRVPWYRGNQPAPYRGLTVCGDPLVWQWGGNAVIGGVPITPNTPVIQTRPDGTAACCEPLFLIGLGGQAEGSQPVAQVVIPVQVVAAVAPQFCGAMVRTDGAQTVPSNVEVDVVFDGSGPATGVFDCGGLADGDFSGLTLPFDGIWRVELSVVWEPVSEVDPAPGVSNVITRVLIDATGWGTDTTLLELKSNGYSPSSIAPSLTPSAGVSNVFELPAGAHLHATAERNLSMTDSAVSVVLSATMLAPATVRAGPTGVCTSNLLIRVVEPVIQVAHTVNETVCLDPNTSTMDCGSGGAWALANGDSSALDCPGGGGSDTVEGAGDSMDLPGGGGYDMEDTSGRFMSCPGGGGSSSVDTLGGAMRCPAGGGYEGA